MSTINILSLTFIQGEYTFSDKRTILGGTIKSRFLSIELHGEYIYIIRALPKLKFIFSFANKYQAKRNFDTLANFINQE